MVVEATRLDSAGIEDVTIPLGNEEGLVDICRAEGFGPVFRAPHPTDSTPPTWADGFPICDLANFSFDGDRAWRAAARYSAEMVTALHHKVHGVDDDAAAFGLAVLTIHALSSLRGRQPDTDEVVRTARSGGHALYGLLAHHLPDDDALSKLEADADWRRRLYHWPYVVDHATRNRRAANYSGRHDPRLLTSAYLFDTPAGRGPDFPKERTGANAWKYRRAFKTLAGWLDA